MTFSRVNPIGWADGERLTSDQMDQLDTNMTKAVDGAAGGTYALTAPLAFTGKPLSARTLEPVQIVSTALSSVDVATYRNLYITWPSSTTTTLTFSLTVAEGDWVDIYNNTSVSQALAGIFAMGLLANRGVRWTYETGSWSITNKWTGW